MLGQYSAWLESLGKKSGDLIEAYHIALDPRQWREDRREMLEKSRTAAAEYARTYMLLCSENDEKKRGGGESRKKVNSITGDGEMAKNGASSGALSGRYNTGDVVLGKVRGFLIWPGWYLAAGRRPRNAEKA